MRLYQPVLYIGLGGTGCDIGAELERRLREEICGPDGMEFARQRSKPDMLPYQLPSCLQFVYADMNQADLERMPGRVVPSSQYYTSARLTAHYVRDLVPREDSYPELARNLRMRAEKEVSPWLPPEANEPRVNPLQRGAGQFPTIGRAALFGTCRHGVKPAAGAIHEAIGKLANSGEDLHAIGGGLPRGVDVFVGFSVAGGTGGGIFYDYLHLVGHMFADSQLRVKIYPLVLMPSAFDPGLGGGRIAELNSGRAMLDLFRLVDAQNGARATTELGSYHDKEPGEDADEQAVYYPVEGRLELRPGLVQTGFLFSRPAGAERDDLHRSVVSLVTSLIGTELEQEDQQHGEAHQSFADSFINSAVHREVVAENGIGNRGVSTALVASLTVPLDEIAGIVAGRLLRTAIMTMAAPGKPEANLANMEDFLVKSGVHPILRRKAADFDEPDHAHGARQVGAGLADRRDSMRSALNALKNRLDREVPEMARAFDPQRAVREMLASEDVFRVQRVVFGHHELTDGYEKDGAVGLLERRRAIPAPPNGQTAAPPGIPHLQNTWFGLRKVRWTDTAPTTCRDRQDQWYSWRTEVTWSESWAAQAATWQRPIDQVRRDLNVLATQLLEFARDDEQRYDRRGRDLYRRRVGVSYLLPPGGADMNHFYDLVIARLVDRWKNDRGLRPTASEADLLRLIVGREGWRDAYEVTFQHSPGQAVADLLAKVKEQVKTFLQTDVPGQLPLLPKLSELLATAAGVSRGNGAMQDYLEEFRGKVAGLMPANFSPQGAGPMKVLVSYPAPAKSPAIADYLRRSINLPNDPEATYDPRPTFSESISVVLFRSAMGITEVREVREVLRLWASAIRREQLTDKLQWRQRTGYNFGYLATREEHRVVILHRMLCALWNGKVVPIGPPESPDRIRMTLSGGVSMILPLTQFGRASSWGSMLRAYELWTFDDDTAHREFCHQLMLELPVGLESSPRPPADLYWIVRELAEGQIKIMDGLLETAPPSSHTRAAQVRGFWAETMQAALEREFTGAGATLWHNLLGLEGEFGKGGS